jgi:hypothetical protein
MTCIVVWTHRRCTPLSISNALLTHIAFSVFVNTFLFCCITFFFLTHPGHRPYFPNKNGDTTIGYEVRIMANVYSCLRSKMAAKDGNPVVVRIVGTEIMSGLHAYNRCATRRQQGFP